MMMNRGSLAVHQFFRVHDFAAERLADRLMAETHAKDGIFPEKRSISDTETPASFGVPGPGEITIWCGCSSAIWSSVISSLR